MVTVRTSEANCVSSKMNGVSVVQESKDNRVVAAFAADATGSLSNGSKFVQAIGLKGQIYLKILEQIFGFSSLKGYEDPSSLTIEYLWNRLQVQREEYKAEKQRSQQLARKVLELEQKLNLKFGLSRKEHCGEMMPSHDNDCSSWVSLDLSCICPSLNRASDELYGKSHPLVSSQFTGSFPKVTKGEGCGCDVDDQEISNSEIRDDGDQILCSYCKYCCCRCPCIDSQQGMSYERIYSTQKQFEGAMFQVKSSSIKFRLASL